MVNREISGSGRINASVFVDGKSMMKDCSVKHGEEVGAGNQTDRFSGDPCGILESILCRVATAR